VHSSKPALDSSAGLSSLTPFSRSRDSFECSQANVCNAGIPSVEFADGKHCFPASCGECDGSDCEGDRVDCCGVGIETSGSDYEAATPCIIDTGKGRTHRLLVAMFPSALRRIYAQTSISACPHSFGMHKGPLRLYPTQGTKFS